jgi:hypothetical protein
VAAEEAGAKEKSAQPSTGWANRGKPPVGQAARGTSHKNISF